MKRYWLYLLFVCGLAAGLWSAAAYPVQAHDPQAVELAYFIGMGVPQGVDLEWRTSTEYGTAAFRMKRASNANGPFDYITVMLDDQVVSVIPTYGFPETGGTYLVTDVTATTGVTYWYTLIEVLDSGSEAALETISVVAGYNPSPTPTSQVIGGGNNTPATATATATATSPAAATPTATLPPTNTAVPTSPAATATPRPLPTNTPIPPAIPATVTPVTAGNNGSNSGNTPASPTPAGDVVLASPGTTENGQPIAQVTASAPSAYPGETVDGRSAAPEATAPASENYPEGQPVPPGEATMTPYPGNGVEFLGTPPTAYQGDNGSVTGFGDETNPSGTDTLPPPAGDTTSTTTNNTPGRIVLWVGFVAGLFIFAAGVFGTILLFTRKQNSPR